VNASGEAQVHLEQVDKQQRQQEKVEEAPAEQEAEVNNEQQQEDACHNASAEAEEHLAVVAVVSESMTSPRCSSPKPEEPNLVDTPVKEPEQLEQLDQEQVEEEPRQGMFGFRQFVRRMVKSKSDRSEEQTDSAGVLVDEGVTTAEQGGTVNLTQVDAHQDEPAGAEERPMTGEPQLADAPVKSPLAQGLEQSEPKEPQIDEQDQQLEEQADRAECSAGDSTPRRGRFGLRRAVRRMVNRTPKSSEPAATVEPTSGDATPGIDEAPQEVEQPVEHAERPAKQECLREASPIGGLPPNSLSNEHEDGKCGTAAPSA